MKRAISSREWSALRSQVWDRDQGLCVACGRPLDPDFWECHHRKFRSRGGKNELCNLVAMCGEHHRWTHSHIYDSLRLGYAVSRYGKGPDQIPVSYWHGGTVLLSNTSEAAA